MTKQAASPREAVSSWLPLLLEPLWALRGAGSFSTWPVAQRREKFRRISGESTGRYRTNQISKEGACPTAPQYFPDSQIRYRIGGYDDQAGSQLV
jgi:hypothetical protein